MFINLCRFDIRHHESCLVKSSYAFIATPFFLGIPVGSHVVMEDVDGNPAIAITQGFNVYTASREDTMARASNGIFHIVGKYSFDILCPDEQFSAMNIKDPREALRLTSTLNTRYSERLRDYRVVLDGYKLNDNG